MSMIAKIIRKLKAQKKGSHAGIRRIWKKTKLPLKKGSEKERLITVTAKEMLSPFLMHGMGKSVIKNTIHEIFGRHHACIDVHHIGDTINKKLNNITYDP